MIKLRPGAISAEDVSKTYRVGEPRSVFSWQALPSLFRRADRGRMLEALAEVSFEIEPGESVGLLGPNGTGKSTLLRILTGITTATRGTARTGGRIGAVLDLGSGFYDELTARDNTFLNAQLLGMTRREVLQKFDSIFEFAELNDFIDAPVAQFSFGMRLRLAFSIAMALDPEILLLDEVMGVGDLAFQRRSAARVRELAARGVTMIVVSHHLSDLASVCQRGLLLRRGRLAADGPIEQTIDAYLNDARPEQTAVPDAASGRGGVQISAVGIRGESGREQYRFQTGDVISLCVTCRADAPVDRPNVRLGLYREDGIYLGLASTENSGYYTGRLAEAAEYVFRWECPFTTGAYRVTATIADSTGKTVLAQAHSAAGFEIASRGGFEHAIVRLDGQWAVTRADALP